MTLYELQSEYTELLQMAEEGELDPKTVWDTLEAVQGEFEDKADAYAMVIQTLAGDVAMCEAEKKRLDERKQRITKNIDRMRAALQVAMQETGHVKFDTARFSFSVRKNPPRVVITDESAVPTRFLTQPAPVVDKTAAKEWLKTHEAAWGRLAQDERLVIK